jgi:hypothetical protein
MFFLSPYLGALQWYQKASDGNHTTGKLKIETQFQAYPWCGYRHLLFDTIVKPLDREKEKTLMGPSCHLIYGKERKFVNLKFTAKQFHNLCPQFEV